MAKFFYIARNKSGEKITGVQESSSQEEALSQLQAKDLLVVNILPEAGEGESAPPPGAKIKGRVRSKHQRITSDDLMLFCRQLATLLSAGVTILRSLDIISQQVSSSRLYRVIRDLQKNMEAGLSFHQAMTKHPKIFSELWINLVESGEASGNLAMVLNRLATYLERNAAFRSKIVSAMIYPLILMVAGLGALLFLTLRIIPTFAVIFSGFNITLPLLTQVLIAFSSIIKRYGLIIVGAGVIAYFLFRKYIATKEGRRNFESFLFSLPLFGEFFRVLVIERFTSEMATLVESGVPILYSLEITEHSVGNLVLGEIISKVKEDVRNGKPLSRPLEDSGFFDPMAVQMVGIGEEIGELSNMFKRLNDFYREYTETFLTRFTSMFEPIMLVFMGVIIGVIVIGMFLPIFQISQIH